MGRITFLILIIYLHNFDVKGQDTLRFYYPVKEFRLTLQDHNKLKSISNQYPLHELDSISIWGFSDSLGTNKSNLKLAQKRVDQTVKHIKAQLKNIPIKTHVVGELYQGLPKNNRRVDILFYFPPQPIKEYAPNTFKISGQCMQVQYSILNKCHLKNVVKNGKSFVQLSTNSQVVKQDLRKRKDIYYGSFSDTGGFQKIAVQWKTDRTYYKSRTGATLVTLIPTEAFKQFKIFTQTNNCDSCSQNFYLNPKITSERTGLQQDFLLMRFLEQDNGFNFGGNIVIHVPKPYVDPDKNYYLGCDKTFLLNWDSSDNSAFYTTQFPWQNRNVITRDMAFCAVENNRSCDSFYPYRRPVFWGRSPVGAEWHHPSIGIETGRIIQDGYAQTYIALKTQMYYGNRFTPQILAGYGFNKSFFSAARLNFMLFDFPIKKGNSNDVVGNYNYWGTFYMQPEVKVSFNKKETYQYLEPNVALGYSMDYRGSYFLPEIFVQYGIGYNFITPRVDKFYGIFQFGLNIKV